MGRTSRLMQFSAVSCLIFASRLQSGVVASPVGRHLVVRIENGQPALESWLNNWAIDTWNKRIVLDGDRAMDVQTSTAGIEALRRAGIKFNIMIPDLGALLSEQASQRELARHRPAASFSEQYHTLKEIQTEMRRLASTYGGEFVASIGASHEGRPISVLRFGGFRGLRKKTFWIQGGMHAREWISPATVMYIAEALLSSQDPTVVALLETLEFAIAPVINPDGYVYSWEHDRMWRKNRRRNEGSTCIGVDMNRNWAEHWGDCGSSTNPCSDTFRGPEPMSELETQAVANFVVGQIRQAEGRDIEAAIDFHSYGELILRPYGWALPNVAKPETDVATAKLALQAQEAIKEVHGVTYTSEHAAELYCASGGADDWFFANATRRSVAGGFTFELRDNGRHGFLLPESEIVPTGEENLAAVLAIANGLVGPTISED